MKRPARALSMLSLVGCVIVDGWVGQRVCECVCILGVCVYVYMRVRVYACVCVCAYV